MSIWANKFVVCTSSCSHSWSLRPSQRQLWKKLKSRRSQSNPKRKLMRKLAGTKISPKCLPQICSGARLKNWRDHSLLILRWKKTRSRGRRRSSMSINSCLSQWKSALGACFNSKRAIYKMCGIKYLRSKWGKIATSAMQYFVQNAVQTQVMPLGSKTRKYQFVTSASSITRSAKLLSERTTRFGNLIF